MQKRKADSDAVSKTIKHLRSDDGKKILVIPITVRGVLIDLKFPSDLCPLIMDYAKDQERVVRDIDHLGDRSLAIDCSGRSDPPYRLFPRQQDWNQQFDMVYSSIDDSNTIYVHSNCISIFTAKANGDFGMMPFLEQEDDIHGKIPLLGEKQWLSTASSHTVLAITLSSDGKTIYYAESNCIRRIDCVQKTVTTIFRIPMLTNAAFKYRTELALWSDGMLILVNSSDKFTLINPVSGATTEAPLPDLFSNGRIRIFSGIDGTHSVFVYSYSLQTLYAWDIYTQKIIVICGAENGPYLASIGHTELTNGYVINVAVSYASNIIYIFTYGHQAILTVPLPDSLMRKPSCSLDCTCPNRLVSVQ